MATGKTVDYAGLDFIVSYSILVYNKLVRYDVAFRVNHHYILIESKCWNMNFVVYMKLTDFFMISIMANRDSVSNCRPILWGSQSPLRKIWNCFYYSEMGYKSTIERKKLSIMWWIRLIRKWGSFFNQWPLWLFQLLSNIC